MEEMCREIDQSERGWSRDVEKEQPNQYVCKELKRKVFGLVERRRTKRSVGSQRWSQLLGD